MKNSIFWILVAISVIYIYKLLSASPEHDYIAFNCEWRPFILDLCISSGWELNEREIVSREIRPYSEQWIGLSGIVSDYKMRFKHE